MTLDAIAVDLDKQIAAEEASIETGIQDARNTHRSMHDGYWKRLWMLHQKRRAVELVALAIADVAVE